MQKGFTLIELMVTLAIAAILGIVVVFNLQGGKNGNDLTDTTQQIAALLREAQSDSMAQEQNLAWGVYFSNVTSSNGPFYVLFAGSSYTTSTEQGGQYRLPSSVGWVNSFLASGATTSISFATISGAASASTSIQLYSVSQPTLSSTITVASSGAISD